MSQINIGRLFETSKVRNTEAGQQLVDMIDYLADFSEQTIRAINGQLNFSSNFSSIVQTVELPHNTPQVVNTNGSVPSSIYVDRVIAGSLITVASFGWVVDENNLVTVQIEYGNTTEPQDVRLTILF